MWAGIAQGGLVSPVLFSLYVHDMPVPSRHVELALYADDTANIATSRKPALLVSYLEAYLSELEQWLREWRIIVSKSNTALREGRVASPQASTGAAPRGANPVGRYSPLSGSDP